MSIYILKLKLPSDEKLNLRTTDRMLVAKSKTMKNFYQFLRTHKSEEIFQMEIPDMLELLTIKLEENMLPKNTLDYVEDQNLKEIDKLVTLSN